MDSDAFKCGHCGTMLRAGAEAGHHVCRGVELDRYRRFLVNGGAFYLRGGFRFTRDELRDAYRKREQLAAQTPVVAQLQRRETAVRQSELSEGRTRSYRYVLDNTSEGMDRRYGCLGSREDE